MDANLFVRNDPDYCHRADALAKPQRYYIACFEQVGTVVRMIRYKLTLMFNFFVFWL